MRFDIDYAALAPVLVPALGAVLVLLVDAVRPGLARVHWWLGALVLFGGAGATVPGFVEGNANRRTLCVDSATCFYAADRLSTVLQMSALVSAAVILLLAIPVPAPPEHAAVSVTMLLASTAGATGVAAARDLGSWLVLVELATLPTVALVALRSRRAALDGALNLLTSALVSFALLALGAALWFAATGSPLLTGDSVADAAADPDTRRILVLAAMIMVAGLGYTLSLVPFHAWVPEAYAGASVPIGGFLAVTSKIAALGALLAVMRGLTALGESALVGIGVVAALSMTLGNLLALRERAVLRLLAWLSIAQAGWVVLPLATVGTNAVRAATGYLLVTSIGTLVVFSGLTLVAHAEGRARIRDLSSLRGLFRRRPLAAAAIAFGLLTLAGVPPSVVGLLAKMLVLRPVVTDELWWLAAIAVLNVILGLAVSLRVILAMAGTSVRGAVTDRASRLHGVVALLGLLALTVLSAAPQIAYDLLT